MTLVTFVTELAVIKFCFMWPINVCDLIWGSVYVLDTMIFDKKNKHGFFFVQDWVDKDISCYLKNFAA